MLAHSSSVDENAIAQKMAQPRGQKGSFGSKSLATSNLLKTPSAASNNPSRRRALGDISNRKIQQTDSRTIDTRTEKKPSKVGTHLKVTQTTATNNKSLHETKSIEPFHQKTVNFTDQISVISIKDQSIDTLALAKSRQKVDDHDEIEQLAGRTWIEERDRNHDSYLSDGSLEFVNVHEKPREMHRYIVEKSKKEYDEKMSKILAAHDKEMELFEQQFYSGVIEEALDSSFEYENDELSSSDESESIFIFEDDWFPSVPMDDLSL